MANNPDRRYSSKLNREDLLLYTIAILLIVFFSFFFVRIQIQNDLPVYSKLDQEMLANLRFNKNVENHSVNQEFLKAQLQVVYKRYELANKIARTIAYIKFIGFLVGTLLVLVGTILVVRGIRNHEIAFSNEIPTSVSNKISFVTNSPGIWITLIGAVIMISTILKGIEGNTSDTGIAFPSDPNLSMRDTSQIIIRPQK